MAYSLPPNVTVGIVDQTSVEGMTDAAWQMLYAAASAAAEQGVQLQITAGRGGGHRSHSEGTEFDLIGLNPDGSRWTQEQRVAIAQGAAQGGADRFGLYSGADPFGTFGGNSLHIGLSGPGRPSAVWGFGQQTSGEGSRAFTNPAERAFLTAFDSGSLRSGQPMAYAPPSGPAPARQPAALQAANRMASGGKQKTMPNTSGYTVRSGDTLWEIAQRELGDGARWQEIAQASGITDPNRLQIGQQLTIPGRQSGSAPATPGPMSVQPAGRDAGDLPTYMKRLLNADPPQRAVSTAPPLPIPNPGPRMAPPPLPKPGPRESGGQAYMQAQGVGLPPRLPQGSLPPALTDLVERGTLPAPRPTNQSPPLLPTGSRGGMPPAIAQAIGKGYAPPLRGGSGNDTTSVVPDFFAGMDDLFDPPQMAGPDMVVPRKVTAMREQNPMDPLAQSRPWQVGTGNLRSTAGAFPPDVIWEMDRLPVAPPRQSRAMNEAPALVAPAGGFYPGIEGMPQKPPPQVASAKKGQPKKAAAIPPNLAQYLAMMGIA